jgi:hypothetical protein
VVLWSATRSNSEWHLGQATYDGQGERTGAAIVTQFEASWTSAPALVCSPDGTFIAAWHQVDAEGETVRAQIFDAKGAPQGAAFRVDSGSTYARWPYAAADGSGNFHVAWTQDGRGLARRFDRAGVPLGDPFDVGCVASVCASASGTLVGVTSRSSGTGTNYFARRYDAGGVPLGPEIQVNQTLVSTQPLGARGVRRGRRLRRGLAAPGRGGCERHLRPSLPGRGRGGQGRAHLERRGVADDARLGLALGGVDDFNADGHADLVLRHQATGAVDVWLQGGTLGVELVGRTTFSGAALPPPEWIVGATADFDGDGRPDVLWRNRSTGRLVVWLMNGTVWRATLVPSPDQAADPNWVVVAAADFDGDGHCDLLWYNTSSGRVVQWLLDASLTRLVGRFTSPATGRRRQLERGRRRRLRLRDARPGRDRRHRVAQRHHRQVRGVVHRPPGRAHVGNLHDARRARGAARLDGGRPALGRAPRCPRAPTFVGGPTVLSSRDLGVGGARGATGERALAPASADGQGRRVAHGVGRLGPVENVERVLQAAPQRGERAARVRVVGAHEKRPPRGCERRQDDLTALAVQQRAFRDGRRDPGQLVRGFARQVLQETLDHVPRRHRAGGR